MCRKVFWHREHRFWKDRKSVHDQPEWVFTFDQNWCSRSTRISVHDGPEYAEFKESIVKRMMPPNTLSVMSMSRETGISDVTLYKWRKDYRDRGIAVPADSSNPENWKAEDKLAVVIETAAMNEVQLAEYCRSKGLYAEQIEQWKRSALSGYQRSDQIEKDKARSRQDDKKKIKKLERELRHKEKALAETAALLVLRKKLNAIWGDEEQ